MTYKFNHVHIKANDPEAVANWYTNEISTVLCDAYIEFEKVTMIYHLGRAAAYKEYMNLAKNIKHYEDNDDDFEDEEYHQEQIYLNENDPNVRDIILYTQNMIIDTNNYILDLQKNIIKHLYFNLKINTLSTLLIVLICITINNVIFYYYTNINYSF